MLNDWDEVMKNIFLKLGKECMTSGLLLLSLCYFTMSLLCSLNLPKLQIVHKHAHALLIPSLDSVCRRREPPALQTLFALRKLVPVM